MSNHINNRTNNNTAGKYANTDKRNATNKVAPPFPGSADPLTTTEKLKRLGLGICICLAALALEVVLFIMFFQPDWIVRALTFIGIAFLGIFTVLVNQRIGYIRGKNDTKAREKSKHLEAIQKLESEHNQELEELKAKHHEELNEAYQMGHEASTAEYVKEVRARKQTSKLVDQLEDELSSAQQTIAEMEKKFANLQQENDKLLQTNAELVEALPADDTATATAIA